MSLALFHKQLRLGRSVLVASNSALKNGTARSSMKWMAWIHESWRIIVGSWDIK